MASRQSFPGKKGFQKVQTISGTPRGHVSAGAGASSAGSSSSSGGSSSKRESRICCCLDSDRCAAIQKAFHELKKDDRVGYSKFSGAGTSAADEKYSLYCETLGIEKSENPTDDYRNTLHVAFTHFPPTYLEEAWSSTSNVRRIDFTVPKNVAQEHGFTRTITRQSEQLYVVTPFYSYDDNEREIAAIRKELEAQHEEAKEKEAAKKQKAAQDVEVRAQLARLNRPAVSAWVSDKDDREENLTAELKEARSKLANTTQELSESLEFAMIGLTRSNITDSEWHAMNPEFWHFCTGIGSNFDEGLLILDALWPGLTDTGAGMNPGDSLTHLEACIMTRMRMRKALEIEFLSKIFGRSHGRISTLVNSWAPRWGAAGLDLSDLDYTEDFIKVSCPQAYQDMHMEKVAVLVDGTDVMTDACRTSSSIKRLGFSDKVHHQGVRGLTYTAPCGLNVIHTNLFFARTSEGALVTEFGRLHKLVPLDKVDMSAPEIDDAADRRIASVQHTTRKVGKSLTKVGGASSSSSSGSEGEEPEGGDPPDGAREGEDDDADDEKQDDEIEAEAGAADKHDSHKKPSIKLCENVKAWFDVQQGIKREKESKPLTTAELTLEDIKAHNTKHLIAYGPNKDAQHKHRQILRHERMHQLYKKGKLTKCIFSYYLHHTTELREQMLLRLTGVVDNNLQPLILHTNLAKLPPGYSVLADRGFANDAPKYPHLNPHITPHFLAKRQQFTKGEVEIDRGVCTLRYTSEVVFAHIFNENTLKDSVRFGLFSILNDSWDWGHASANLLQPLRKPANWDAYIKIK